METPSNVGVFYGTPTRVGGHLSSSQVMSMSGKKPEKLVELDDLLVKYADNLEEVGVF